MNCPELSRLSAFLDETLPPAEAADVAGHIDLCAECQTQIEHLVPEHHVTQTSLTDEMPTHLSVSDQSAVAALIQRLKALVPGAAGVTDDHWFGAVGRAASVCRFDLPFQLDRYTLMELVGEGATGWLYRAFDEQLERQVAIKILKPELAALPSARTRFEREARACAALRHDHIVAVHHVEANRPGQPPYLVMEFVAGQSVQQWARVARVRDLRTAVEWIRQAGTALQAAHDAGIVHRDIKPSNLLIDAVTGRLRVADFGLARLVESDVSLTTDDAIAGTPAYMSPEQIATPKAVTGLSDVYSLGVVMYELLTGERPFRGTVRMVLHQVLHEEPVPPRRLNDQVPRDLETICLKAMAKEERLRYASARELADDLHRWLVGRPVLARPVGLSGRLWRWCRRNPRSAGVTVIVSGVLIGGAIDWGRYRGLAINDRLRQEWKADVARRDELIAESARRELAAERRWQLAWNFIQASIADDALPAARADDAEPQTVGAETTASNRALLALTHEILSPTLEADSVVTNQMALQLADIWMQRGDLAVRAQQPVTAIRGFDQALEILNSPRFSPAAGAGQVERSVLMLKLAAALNRTGDARALVVCREACRLNEELAARGEAMARLRLVESLGELSTCLLRLDERAAAIANRHRQSELLSELVAASPVDTGTVRAAGHAWLQLATLHTTEEAWKAAAASAGTAAMHFRHCCEQSSASVADRLGLAEAELLQITSAVAVGDEPLKLDHLRSLADRLRDVQGDADGAGPEVLARAKSLLARCHDLIEVATTDQ